MSGTRKREITKRFLQSANGLFRYRLLVFSNFLTLQSDVDLFEEELQTLFCDLHAGAVIIVLGAPGGSYPEIYKRLVKIAKTAGLKEPDVHQQRLELRGIENYAAVTIKRAQHRVYLHLEKLVGTSALRKSKSWPDYWDPRPSPKSRPSFAFRVFRRGRWPTRRRTSPGRQPRTSIAAITAVDSPKLREEQS